MVALRDGEASVWIPMRSVAGYCDVEPFSIDQDIAEWRCGQVADAHLLSLDNAMTP